MTLRDLIDLYAGLLVVAVLFDLGCYVVAIFVFRGQIRQWWLNRRHRRRIEREFQQRAYHRGVIVVPSMPPTVIRNDPWPPADVDD